LDSSELEAAVRTYYRCGFGGRVAPHLEEYYVDSSLDSVYADAKLKRVLRYKALQAGDRILEVGCGFGSFMLTCAEAGYDAIGLDPNEYDERMPVSVLKIAQMRMPPGRNRLVAGYGERLPFSAETFDAVAMFEVLEHVRDPKLVLREAYRVLKTDGVIYVHAPNYLSFYEGHYGLPWLPLFPKPLARIYVRLLRRDPDFLEHLHYTTPAMIEKLLAELGYQKFRNVAVDSFREKMENIDQMGSSVYRWVGKLIRAFGLLRLAEKLVEWGWVYPVCFTVLK
jgi:ubiquinone/menaquinone biosynthesis C-methylase UbiE